MNAVNALAQYVAKTTAQLTKHGLAVQLGKTVPYGQQLVVQDAAAQTVVITLYAGKKGESTVLGGKETPLRQQVAVILGHAPAEADPVAPAAAATDAYCWPEHPLWAGSDESGKGDLFGPLVVASVVLTKEQAKAIAALGVKDSKQIADGQINALANHIKAIATDYEVIALLPASYNRLYDVMRAEGKNLNDLLAWCHAKALSDLLARRPFPFAVIDRFSVRDLISRRVKGAPADFTLLQIPKGERDPAVAAASVLARERYLAEMAQLSCLAGVALPKGASADVRDCAGLLLRRLGPEALKQYVKWHFKTIGELY